MFEIEARWVADQLAAVAPSEISPLLNIGSSTREFRETVQPWTMRIFSDLAERGVEVVHLDTRPGDGIDIRADLLDDADFDRVRRRSYRSVLCCNILEHVVDPVKLAERCSALVQPGGLIVVTVPRSYPHHGDPIDTMFRPSPAEAAALFPTADIVAADILDVDQSYRDEVRRRPWILLRHVLRLPVPFLGIEKWARSMRKPYWLFHNYRVTALVLRRRHDARAGG